MRTNCFIVGYIDLEERHEILSYVVTSFNERRLAAWSPPLELASDGFEKNAVLARNGLGWFQGEAMLIVDNCDYVLQDEKGRKEFFMFLEIMIRNNEKGRIVVTSEEELNLDSQYYKSMNFEIGSLSDEASIKLLKLYSPGLCSHDAKEISITIENCPIALRLTGSWLLRHKTPNHIVERLRDRKNALKELNKTEHKHLNFILVMDEALSFLGTQEKMSAMFFSFFPGHFVVETAASIMMQSEEKYNLHAGILDTEDAADSIEELERRSLLDISSFAEVMRCKMHRLIKVYFMDRGDRYDSQMETDFNSSFRIYFSNLGVRRQPVERIRAIEIELLSDHDRSNFNYLTLMLLTSFKLHLYSEDELIYLAFSFHKGLIHYDYVDFKVLLALYTYHHPQVAILPNEDLDGPDFLKKIAFDFDNFFVNVLCEVTTHEVCISVYLDLLYKLYEAEKCNVTFEDT